MNTPTFDYHIVRMRRKSIALHLLKDGTLEVRAPYRVSEKILADFVENKKRWVEKAKIRQSQAVTLPVFSPDDLVLIRENTNKKVHAFVDCFPGLKPTKINIRKQKSVWGTCNKKGVISINAFCSLLPEPLFEYIMVHELCHLKELNHSTRFWAHVSGYVPDWKEKRTALKNFRIGAR
jgi:predicted metal-dependent hydrolase